MPVNIRHKVNVEIPGLKKLNVYLAGELRGAAFKVGYKLQEDVRAIQRKDTGQERARTVFRVTSRSGGLNVLLRVYNDTIQGNVDETGAKPHFPPYKAGSKLYQWVLRKGLAEGSKTRLGGQQRRAISARVRADARAGGASRAEATLAGRQAVKDTAARLDKQVESVSFLIARAISRRGLPRPGDPLRKPFETVRRKSDNMIRTIFNFATLKAVKRANDAGTKAFAKGVQKRGY